MAGRGNPLTIGATIPDFQLKTTHGDFGLHDFLNKDEEWNIFFSHPGDFTPVCTTELGMCHQLNDLFKGRNTKLIGLSCDEVETHKAWEADILAREGTGKDDLGYPMISDTSREIVHALGMLDPEEERDGLPMPARLLVILHKTTVKLSILYPATTGRNFEEVLRVLVSLQMTSGQGMATPVNWTYGGRMVCGGAVTEDVAKERGYSGYTVCPLPSEKPYLCTIDCIPEGMERPQ